MVLYYQMTRLKCTPDESTYPLEQQKRIHPRITGKKKEKKEREREREREKTVTRGQHCRKEIANKVRGVLSDGSIEAINMRVCG